MKFFAMADPNSEHQWMFCYFDGQAEDTVQSEWNNKQPEGLWSAPDLIGSDTPRDKVPDGKHEGLLYGYHVNVYIWTDPRPSNYLCAEEDADTSNVLSPEAVIHTRKGIMRRGYIVLSQDKEANERAAKLMAEKAEHI